MVHSIECNFLKIGRLPTIMHSSNCNFLEIFYILLYRMDTILKYEDYLVCTGACVVVAVLLVVLGVVLGRGFPCLLLHAAYLELLKLSLILVAPLVRLHSRHPATRFFGLLFASSSLVVADQPDLLNIAVLLLASSSSRVSARRNIPGDKKDKRTSKARTLDCLARPPPPRRTSSQRRRTAMAVIVM